jgi:hypothetical protein
MSDPKILIDIPTETGVRVRTGARKGIKYVYFYSKSYRNEQGMKRVRAKIIGKVDDETGKMIPNSNYYDMHSHSVELPSDHVWIYGYEYLVKKSCEDFGLWTCLSEVFGDETDQIVSTAAFMIREGNNLDFLDDFQAKNLRPGPIELVTDKERHRLFKSISDHKIQLFFQKWLKANLKKSAVYYELKSVSSRLKALKNLDMNHDCGHNDDWSQFNVGIFCNEKSKIPFYYNCYNQSSNENSNFDNVLEKGIFFNLENVKLILEHDYFNQKHFQRLNKLGLPFTIELPPDLELYQDLAQQNIIGLKAASIKGAKGEILLAQKSISLYGLSGKLILILNDNYQDYLNDKLSYHIELLSSELSSIKRYTDLDLARYPTYFIFKKHHFDSGFDFQVDSVALNKIRQNSGFLPIFTTDPAIELKDIRLYYQSINSDERLFDQIIPKTPLNKPQVFDKDLAQGKIFVSFLALTIKRYLQEKLDQYIIKNSSSLNRVLNILDNPVMVYPDGTGHLSKSLTEEQKKIFLVFRDLKGLVATIESL